MNDDIPAVWIDRSSGSGALGEVDEYNDSQAIRNNDGRGQTRTTFYVDYSDNEVDHSRYERLARINDGQYASDRSQQNNAAEKRNFAELACNRLELTNHQTERTVYVVQDVDMASFAASHKTVEQVTLGTISLVVDSTSMNSYGDVEEWDIEDWIIYDSQFQELMDVCDMSMDDLWTVRKMMMNNTDYFEDSESG